MDVVGVEGGGVAVVVVHDRQAEPVGERAAEVEAPPFRLGEVRGALGGDHSVGAGRTGSVQAHPAYRGPLDPGQLEDVVQRVGERLDGDLRPLQDPARRLDHPVHQEFAGGRQHGGVVLGATVVQPDNHPAIRHCHP